MTEAALSEVPERAAPGEIAAIYAALREALGVPMVNLVFRHMATVDGCLPWAWGGLEPFYRGGALHEAGARMATLAQAARIGRVGVRLVGMRAETVTDTLTAYIRANPINMIGLTALGRTVEGVAAGADSMTPGAPARLTPIAQILPMADLSTVPARSLDKLRSLATLLHGEPGPVVPSLFRHFAAWPVALEVIETVLSELVEGGTLDSVARDMEAYGMNVAARLAVTPPWPADDAIAACIRRLVELFPANMTRMTVVAIALRDALV